MEAGYGFLSKRLNRREGLAVAIMAVLVGLGGFRLVGLYWELFVGLGQGFHWESRVAITWSASSVLTWLLLASRVKGAPRARTLKIGLVSVPVGAVVMYTLMFPFLVAEGKGSLPGLVFGAAGFVVMVVIFHAPVAFPTGVAMAFSVRALLSFLSRKSLSA